MTDDLEDVRRTRPTKGQMERLKQLRRAMGFGAYGGGAGFARLLGVSPERWNNIERGAVAISRDVAERIVRKCPGITRDWLFDGDASGLTGVWLEQLGAFQGNAPTDVKPAEVYSAVGKQRCTADPPQRYARPKDAALLAEANTRAILAEQRLADLKQMLGGSRHSGSP